MEKEQTITIPLTKIIQVITTIYLLIITVLLPLYHRDGFCFIGDRKYRLFFMSSAIMQPTILLLIFIRKIALIEKIILSVTDLCVIGYAGFAVVSCLLSPYREVAIWGYEDWHMGTITQLMLVGIYFAVSRGWKWHTGTIAGICAVSGVIFLLGVLNRFAIDPLRMFEGLEYWNKTHLLATIGNINWYSGYVCAIVPIGLWYFWSLPLKSSRWKREIFSFFYCCVAFATLITQGSESGLAALLAIFAAFSYFSLESRERIYRFLQMNVMLGATTCLLGILYLFCDKEQIYFAADLAIDRILLQPMWWIYTGIMIVMLLGYRYRILKIIEKIPCKGDHAEDDSNSVRTFQSEKYQKIFRYCLAGMLIIVGSEVLLHMNKDWGSGRGLLWSVVCKAYIEMPVIKKLFGVGADCFAPYLYTHYAQLLEGFLAEWWGNALVANAHNEWLNVLINNGILGMLAYIGIFTTAIYRWICKRRNMQVLIALSICVIGYMVNNTVSFQQVVSTPIIFTILGMGEGLLRKNARI